ncbi:MAG: hypothetical protein ABI211_03480 [Vicinamibacterales bacterium]
MHQNVTVAMGIIASCFSFDGPRRRIVMSDQEFPSNMYLFEGFRRYGAEVVDVASADRVQPDLEPLLEAIDERTVLVPLSAVLFRPTRGSGWRRTSTTPRRRLTWPSTSSPTSRPSSRRMLVATRK